MGSSKLVPDTLSASTTDARLWKNGSFKQFFGSLQNDTVVLFKSKLKWRRIYSCSKISLQVQFKQVAMDRKEAVRLKLNKPTFG
jgi:hypothetical protein